MRHKRQAQEALYHRFSYMMKGVCIRYSSNPEEAEDILQDSFVKAFSKLDSFSGKGSLGGWLRRITVNTALEYYRRQKMKGLDPEINERELNQLKVNDDAIANLDLEDLVKKIQTLPAGYRSVFNLYAVEGYTHKEIGELLGISTGTSKSQYSRARFLLQKMINLDNEQIKQNFNYAG